MGIAPLPPLDGDPDRQATEALRGYWYQILQTIYEWLDLREGDRLYLEGAEDFDRISESEATATQVKHSDTTATITLRSPAIVSAIDSYWSLRQHDSQKTVRLNFLTTAAIGVEAGKPFGADRGGLNVWMDAARQVDDASDQQIRLLTDFLLREKRASAELLAFLQSATPETVRSELLRPVGWKTRAPGIGSIKAAVVARLERICVQKGLTTGWAGKVLDRLVTATWETVTQRSQEARVLTREDFERYFIEAETLSLRASALPELISGTLPQGLMSLFAGMGVSALALVGGSSRFTGIPPLLEGRLAREPLQAHIKDALDRCSLVQLQGSTGLGKTTEAAVLAATLEPPCQWVNCRDIDKTQLRIILSELTRTLESASPPRHIVFDDIDVLEHVSILEESLPGILYVVSQRTGGLILTSNRNIPHRLLTKLGLTADCIVPIPAFDEVEVRTLLQRAGLSDDALLVPWGRLILAKTGGHPGLVRVHIATLARKQFPPLTLEDVTNVPAELQDEQESARLLLRNDLPAGERDLLYRLSVVAGLFGRDQAIALGQYDPPIPQPGDAFDSLVGPWIEHFSDTRYRLSPLLSNAGLQANGPAWVRQTHSAIAWTWLQFKQLTPWDVSTILVSATLAEEFDAIVRLGTGLMHASDEVWAAIAESNLLFVRFYAGKAGPFEGNALQRFYLRFIQIQLATHGPADVLADILDRIEVEFPAGENDPSAAAFGYMLRLQILVHDAKPIGVSQLVRIIEGLARDTDMVFEQIQARAPGSEVRELSGNLGTLASGLFGPYLVRSVTTMAGLDETLQAINGMEAALRSRCLSFFRDIPDMGRQWADALWLTEQQASQPHWQSLAEALLRLYNQALQWNETTLAQAVASVLARVRHENLSDTAGALALLTQAPSSGAAGYLLLDARAKILLQTGEPAEAIEFWNDVLNHWPRDVTGNLAGFAIAARNAGVAAARLDDWALSSEFFERAAAPGLDVLDARFACGLLADAAHAAWHAGQFARSIDLAERAIRGLSEIPNTAEDLRSFYLHKLIGHLMTWIAGSTKEKKSALPEPSPETCSDLDPSEEVTKYNPTPFALTQFSLVSAARGAGLPLARFQTLIGDLRNAPYPMVRMGIEQLLLEEAIDRGSVDDIVSNVALMFRAQAASAAQKSSGAPLWLPYETSCDPDGQAALSDTDADFWKLQFSLAVLALAARQIAMAPKLTHWHSEATTRGAPLAVLEWLEAVRDLENSAPRVVLRAMQESTDGFTRLTAYAILLGRPAIDPLFILHVNVNALALAQWSLVKMVVTEVCGALAQAWKSACEHPTTFQRSADTVPSLLEACNEPSESMQKVARMFLAATPALNVVVPPEVMQQAHRLAV